MTKTMTWFRKYAELRPISPQEIKDFIVRNKAAFYGVGGMLGGTIATALAHKYAKNKAYAEAEKHVKVNKSLADELSESFIKKHKLGDVSLVRSDSGSTTPTVKIVRKNGDRQIRISVPQKDSPYSNVDDPIIRLLALGRAKAALSNPKTHLAHRAAESIPYKVTATALRFGFAGSDKPAQKYTSLAMRSVAPQLQASLNTEAENHALQHLMSEAPEEVSRGVSLSKALAKTYKYDQIKPVTMYASSRLGFNLGKKLGGG